MPRIDTSHEHVGSLVVMYQFRILNEDKQNCMKFGMTDSLVKEYCIPGQYDQVIVKLFAYVLDKVKENPYAEGVKMVFSTENRPGNTYNDWDTNQSIEAINNYQIQV